MTENDYSVEARLRRLGHRLRLGMVRRHPLKAETIQAVRSLVRKQWEMEQEHKSPGGHAKQPPEKPAQAAKEQPADKPDSKSKSQDQSWGQSH